jgi:hypothetical protein
MADEDGSSAADGGDRRGADRRPADPRLRRHSGPKGAEAISEIEARLGGLLGLLGARFGGPSAEGGGSESAGGQGGGAKGGGAALSVAQRVHGGTVGDVLAARAAEDGAGAGGGAARRPLLRRHRKGGAELIEIELPGVATEALDWRIAAGRLRLETAGEPAFALDMELPEGLGGGAPEARFENGLLTLRFEDP